jgi:hypothetical protein
MRPTLQSGGCIMYSYTFHTMKFYFPIASILSLCKQHLGLSCERFCMARLDDCNILQPGHLVWNKLGGTHDSINVQTLRSHSFTCGSSHAMHRMTKEHLAWCDLRKTRVSGGTRYPITMEDQCLRMSGQAILGSTPCGRGTKNWSHQWKTLRSTIWARFWSKSSKTSNALWARHMMPTSLGTRMGTTWWKSRLLERTGTCDSCTRWLRMPKPTRLS